MGITWHHPGRNQLTNQTVDGFKRRLNIGHVLRGKPAFPTCEAGQDLSGRGVIWRHPVRNQLTNRTLTNQLILSIPYIAREFSSDLTSGV